MHHRIARWLQLPTPTALLHGALFSLLICVPLLGTTGLPQAADAQSQLEIRPLGNAQSALERGKALERQRKWTDALSHYEKAVRQYPNDPQLRGRQDLARIHYDLTRRYHDTSFRSSLDTLSLQETAELYSEVLLKVDAHFVKQTNWQRLVDRGTRCVEIGLSNDKFLEQNLASVSATRIAAARDRFRGLMDTRPVHSRRDAQAAVSYAARQLHSDLGIKPAAVVMEYIAGASGGLDTYSAYLTSDQLKDVYSQIDGNFVGLGIELKADDGSLLIVSVISGSPAAKAGIRAGDRIEMVDGQPTKELTTDQAAVLLQGVENSYVNLVVTSDDQSRRALRVKRQHIDVPSVDEVKLVDEANAVGYMRLVSFQRSTSRDMDAALWNLYHQGMKSLIIDVRGNPGGLLSASVDIADKFVPQGTIVSTRGRSKQEDYDYAARRLSTWQVPLVVLVDENSASASEIFAAAIQDHRRGTIVGHRSYGKGSVQGIFPLARAGAGLRLTTAKFYAPSGRPISQAGVTPDVVVHSTAKPSTSDNVPSSAETEDVILKAGINTALRKVASR